MPYPQAAARLRGLARGLLDPDSSLSAMIEARDKRTRLSNWLKEPCRAPGRGRAADYKRAVRSTSRLDSTLCRRREPESSGPPILYEKSTQGLGTASAPVHSPWSGPGWMSQVWLPMQTPIGRVGIRCLPRGSSGGARGQAVTHRSACAQKAAVLVGGVPGSPVSAHIQAFVMGTTYIAKSWPCSPATHDRHAQTRLRARVRYARRDFLVIDLTAKASSYGR